MKTVTTFFCILLWFYVNIGIEFRHTHYLYFYYTALWLHVSSLLGHLQVIRVFCLKQKTVRDVTSY